MTPDKIQAVRARNPYRCSNYNYRILHREPLTLGYRVSLEINGPVMTVVELRDNTVTLAWRDRLVTYELEIARSCFVHIELGRG